MNGWPASLKAGGVVNHQAGGFHVHRHLRQFELYSLEFGDRLAELFALLGIGDGVIQRALRQSGHLRADADAALIQRLDGDLVAFAHFADDVGFGNAAIVQNQLAGGGGADAQLVLFLADGEAREIALDQKRRDAFVARFRD